MTDDAPRQLAMLPDLLGPDDAPKRPGTWRLDRATRARGLRGVEEARRALADATARRDEALTAGHRSRHGPTG